MPRVKDKVNRLPPRMVVCVFALIAIAGLWTVTLREIVTKEGEAIAAATKDASNIARALEEHTARTIQSADQAVLFLKYEYERQGLSFDIARYLGTGVIRGDIFNLFSIVDAHGDVVLSSRPFIPMNVADREHINVHFAQDSHRLFVSKPVFGRVSGKWSIQMTRRLNAPDGSLAGVVIVSLDPFYFSRLYKDVDLGADASVTLVGQDGIVRAREAQDDASIGKDLRGQRVFETISKGGSGHTRGVSSLDGIDRIYAYRELNDYPLFVVVGVAVHSALVPFYKTRQQALVLASVTTLVIAAATAVLMLLISRVERARARAEEMSRSKSEFLANMSHELRTPLNGILGYAELLQDDLRDTPQGQFADAIHTSGKHLLEIVNDVLDIEKIESGHATVTLASESPRTVMEQAIESHRGSARRKGLALDLAIAPDVPATFLCDRTKVLRVLNNLLHNAIKFTDTGSVKASLERLHETLVFTVRDTGPGIPRELHEAIFDKFVQADSSIAKAHEGTGLGLALCRDLCELMRGRIWLRSPAGEGAVFSFALPIEPQAAQVELEA